MTFLTIDDCESLSPREVRRLYKSHVNPALENVLYSFAVGQDLVERSEGVWLYCKSGKKVLDVSGGYGVLNHGHNHPRIIEARMRYQRAQRMEVHKAIFSPYTAALSHNLAQLLPGDLDYPYFCNSGSEAVEGALKLAYKYHEGKRNIVLHAGVSFHGKLLGSGGMTDVLEDRFVFPTIPGIRNFDYESIDSVKLCIDDARQENGESDVYALIIEPFNAITLSYCTSGHLQELRALCDREKIVLIMDEVFCGWCKTGNFFRFMDAEIVPDLLITSKSLGGGKASISAYIARKPLLMKAYGQVADATLHSTTYNGFGEECATAIEAVNIMVEEDYPAKSRHIERKVKERSGLLMERFSGQIEEVRGAGALHGIFLQQEHGLPSKLLQKLPVPMFRDGAFVNKIVVAGIVDWLFKRHDIFTYFNNNRESGIMFSPPLVIEDAEIDYFFDAFEATLEQGVSKIVAEFVKSKIVKTISR